MHKIRKRRLLTALLMVLLLSPYRSVHAQKTMMNVKARSYNADVRLDVMQKRIAATMELTLGAMAQKTERLTFLLNKNAVIKELRWNDQAATFTFDTNGVSPNRYLPDARTLTILTPGMTKGRQRLWLKYDCLLNDLKHRGCLFEENWIELNAYGTWFPINYDYGPFSYEVNIEMDKRYQASGSGIVTGGEGHWRLTRDSGDTEIVLIASPELQTRRYEKDGRAIRVDSIHLTDAQAETMLAACRDTFDRYEKWFGKADGKNLTLTVNPTRNVTSYARRGFISLQTEGRTEKDLYQSIGHEIGHFWWKNAISTDTWEDWLNESFAEYSALLNGREKYGEESFRETLARYRKVAAPLPPLWEINRGGDEGAIVLYRKGPIILQALDEKIGHEFFLRLLNEIATRKIARTADLLTLVERKTSAETRRSLEESLKK